MLTQVLKLSEIKKDPTCLIGCDIPSAITRYGDVVAYVVSPERMRELLEAERKINTPKTGFQTGRSSIVAVSNYDIRGLIDGMSVADYRKLAY